MSIVKELMRLYPDDFLAYFPYSAAVAWLNEAPWSLPYLHTYPFYTKTRSWIPHHSRAVSRRLDKTPRTEKDLYSTWRSMADCISHDRVVDLFCFKKFIVATWFDAPRQQFPLSYRIVDLHSQWRTLYHAKNIADTIRQSDASNALRKANLQRIQKRIRELSTGK